MTQKVVTTLHYTTYSINGSRGVLVKSFGHADKCLIPVCSEFCQNLEHETVYPSVLSY